MVIKMMDKDNLKILMMLIHSGNNQDKIQWSRNGQGRTSNNNGQENGNMQPPNGGGARWIQSGLSQNGRTRRSRRW